MIPRYTLPEMAALWSDEARYRTWIEVELAVMAAQESVGMIPPGVAADVAARAQTLPLDVARIEAIEAETRHDVIAFLTHLAEHLGENSRYVHLGMTSSDLLDTALSLQLQRAGALLREKLATLRHTTWRRADEYRHTAMIGRSHGIHGEPITFGLKLLGWVDELDRHAQRLHAALEENRVGMMSGAMGAYSHCPPQVEALACEALGLRPAKTSTQVIARDIHAMFFLALAGLASSVEKFAVELRHLQRTEVLEVEEAFAKGQKGSSAMPHKRNPISGENLTGLARLIRAFATPALENIALWHERDISHSSVERVAFPDACILAHYMLTRANTLIDGLGVYPQNMARNLALYGGVVFSQRVLLALVDHGLSREAAYKIVQGHAHAAWNHEGGDFRRALQADPQVTALLSPEALAACFEAQPMLQHVDAVFARFES